MLKIALTAMTEDANYILRKRYTRVLTEIAAAAEIEILPLILPSSMNPAQLHTVAAYFDGFLFTGGDDVTPTLYGEKAHPACRAVESDRDTFELSLLAEIFPTGKPILGICRGCQIMNVFCGGTLWQDIPSQLAHLYPDEKQHAVKDTDGIPRHTVHLSGALRTRLGKAFVTVNSFHHQSIHRVGTNLTVCAQSEEGIIEAIAHEQHPFFCAVQWHPEISPDAISEAIFTDFLRTAEKKA